MIAKKVYVGECAGSGTVGKPRKNWIDIVINYMKKKRFGCQASKGNSA